jgi:hypothetical protein
MVARLAQGSAKDCADSAGADDADVQPGRSLRRCWQIIHAGNASAFPKHVAFSP